MVADPIPSPARRTSAPAAVVADRDAAPALSGALSAAARGMAIGTLTVSLVAAAYAGQNLHLLGTLGDALIGIGLVGAAIVIVWLALAIPAWLIGRGLQLVARRAPRTDRFIHRWPLPVVRVIGRPLVASTVAIAGMLWLSPDSGPLSMFQSITAFEILIVTGAVVGLLAGVAWWVAHRHRPVSHRWPIVAAILVPATALGVGMAAWAALPGSGDPIIREDPGALAAIPLLDLPDPSLAGDHEVVTATYGSGIEGRRAEFGAEADWITPTVDASAALPPRDEVATFVADTVWGFGADRIPINGLVWFPAEGTEPMPVALMVHGNHAAGDSSDPGYAYLGEHLASHGVIAISVDENYLNGDAFYDYGGREMGVRAWLLLRHLDQLRTWNHDPGHPLSGRVDLDRVALIGHSRGGESAALAAAIEAGDDEVNGMPDAPRGFGIRAVVGIAPSDGMYSGPAAPIQLTDIDYLVLQGAHDGDLPAFSGLSTYHRVELTGAGDHLKVALYSERANHGRFNSVWDVGDAGPLNSWMLDRGSLLSAEEQQRLAKTAIGAFLARSLFGQTEYDAFFREPRSGRDWLPDDVVQTHWESSGRLVVADDLYRDDRENMSSEGFDVADGRDPMLRDRTTQGDRAISLRWSSGASLEVSVDPALAADVNADGRLTISLARAETGPVDPIIELRSRDGTVAAVRLSDVSPARPTLPTRLWKLDWLGERYMPEETLAWPAERFLQTHAIPLAEFTAVAPGFDVTQIEAVTIRLDRSGSLWLDDLGFEPA